MAGVRKLEYQSPKNEQLVAFACLLAFCQEGANQSSDTLMSASIPVVDRDLCNDNYSDLGGITDRMFCAGEKGHDTCQGDSGGPVAQNGEIVGITSQGLGCARAGYPGIYTNVASEEIRTFIRDNASV